MSYTVGNIIKTEVSNIAVIELLNYLNLGRTRYKLAISIEGTDYGFRLCDPFFSLEQAYKLLDFMIKYNLIFSTHLEALRLKEYNLGLFNVIEYWNTLPRTPSYMDSPFISTRLYFWQHYGYDKLQNWTYAIFYNIPEKSVKLFLEQDDYRLVKTWLRKRARKAVNKEYPKTLPGFKKKLELALLEGLLRYYNFTQAYWNGKDFKGFMESITDKSEPFY